MFVSDVRFVFPSTAHCQTYFQAAMVGHPELFFDADDGSMQPRMVEMQSSDKSFHVGDMCRTFCGPTAMAREKLMASVAAGKTMKELQIIAERAIKTVHLLYLFCVVCATSLNAMPCHAFCHHCIMIVQTPCVLACLEQYAENIAIGSGSRYGKALRDHGQRLVSAWPFPSACRAVQGPLRDLDCSCWRSVCTS